MEIIILAYKFSKSNAHFRQMHIIASILDTTDNPIREKPPTHILSTYAAAMISAFRIAM